MGQAAVTEVAGGGGVGRERAAAIEVVPACGSLAVLLMAS